MGCVCVSRHNYDRVFNDYWKAMSIRTIKPDVFCDKIKTYKLKTLVSDVAVKNKFISDFFDSNCHNKAITKEMIYDMINSFKNEGGGVLLSLLFLTSRDRSGAKKAYLELDKLFEVGSVVLKDNGYYFKKAKFVDIILYYTNLISLFCVIYIATLSDDKQDCIHEMTENFRLEYQISLINSWLDKYTHCEFINVDEFFENEYLQFSDDVAIRDGLSCIFYEMRQNSYRKNI
jgi:hypothetical protein